jgi:hypothetical protein
LELHSIASSGYCHADQPFGEIDVAVVVDANLCNDKTWLIVTDQSVAYLDNTHGKVPPDAAFAELPNHMRNAPPAIVVDPSQALS